MISVDSITNALYTILSSNSVLVNSAFTVQLGAPVNGDTALTPWVGVYLDNVHIIPHAVGGQPWLGEIGLALVVQEYALGSPQTANERLYRALTPVLSAVNSNKNLSNTIDIIQEITVEPFDRDRRQDDWFFELLVSIKGERRLT